MASIEEASREVLTKELIVRMLLHQGSPIVDCFGEVATCRS